MLLARQGMHSVNTAACVRRSLSCQASSSARLAVVGDVHNQWSQRDAAALTALNADFTLFVGDFGNENVAVVQQIAGVDVPKAAILYGTPGSTLPATKSSSHQKGTQGNHDAWYTMTARTKSRSRSPLARTSAAAVAAAGAEVSSQRSSGHAEQQQAAEDDPPDRVQQQLDALGDCHVGYAHRTITGTNMSLVGARPFSKGGKSFRTIREFMGRLYGVYDMGESAQRIMDVITSQVSPDDTLILMGHNGPAGLGAQRHNICGVDWVKEAGDHGDPDLQSVLQQLKDTGRHVALVVFGHMHHMLQGKGKRQMVHVDSDTGTVFLNSATVPRVAVVPQRGAHTHPVSKHHFLVIDVVDGRVRCAADAWVHVTDDARDDLHPQENGHPTFGSVNSQIRKAQATVASSNNVQHSSTCSGSTSTWQQSGVLQLQQRDSIDKQPLQIALDQQQKSIDGFAVRVAEICEVFRTVDSSRSGQQHHQQQGTQGSRCVEYWDAFHGEWKAATLPSWPVSERTVAVAQASGMN